MRILRNNVVHVSEMSRSALRLRCLRCAYLRDLIPDAMTFGTRARSGQSSSRIRRSDLEDAPRIHTKPTREDFRALIYVYMYICIYVYMYICIYMCSSRLDLVGLRVSLHPLRAPPHCEPTPASQAHERKEHERRGGRPTRCNRAHREGRLEMGGLLCELRGRGQRRV